MNGLHVQIRLAGDFFVLSVFWNVIRIFKRCAADCQIFWFVLSRQLGLRFSFDRTVFVRRQDLWCMKGVLTRRRLQEAVSGDPIVAVLHCSSETFLKRVDVLQIIKDPKFFAVVEQSGGRWCLIS